MARVTLTACTGLSGGYGALMSDLTDGPVEDGDRELSPYDDSGDAEAPADDLNLEEELRDDGSRPVFGDDSLVADPALADPYSDPQTRPAGSPTGQEEAAYSLEEPSEDVE